METTIGSRSIKTQLKQEFTNGKLTSEQIQVFVSTSSGNTLLSHISLTKEQAIHLIKALKTLTETEDLYVKENEKRS